MKFSLLHSRPFPSLPVLAILTMVFLAACGSGAPAATAVIVPTEAGSVTEPAVIAEQPTATTPAVSSESGASFSQDVQPILAASCTRCHGSSRQSGGLRLDSLASLMAGGRDGQVVIPGNAADSLLVQLITEGTMPKNAADLPQASIQTIVDWVNAGAIDN
jgi:cytochrome c553